MLAGIHFMASIIEYVYFEPLTSQLSLGARPPVIRAEIEKRPLRNQLTVVLVLLKKPVNSRYVHETPVPIL